MKKTLQEILTCSGTVAKEVIGLYYRGKERLPQTEDGGFFVKDGGIYDFSSYYNMFSVRKWKTYCNVDRVSLELDISGSFCIELYGFYADATGKVCKESIGRFLHNGDKRRRITADYPQDHKYHPLYTCVSFSLEGVRDCVLFGGRYFADVKPEDIKDPFITLATTTYKKEDYIEKNIDLLKKELFSDKFYKDRFNWIIVDNGNTLDKDSMQTDDERIRIITNPNVGGSGGFSRAMIEANRQKKKASHLILMDDDVEIFSESFKRVYTLLSLLKDEYSEYFISGAMLEIEKRNIQHEDIGYTKSNGEHGPVKPRLNLSFWENVVKNELPVEDSPRNYAGWWFCCIPMTVARPDNLPLPLFVRGDDVEYSVRNKARFITMNGICIWHQGFGNKFSAPMEFYQVHRNDLIWKAVNPHVKGVNVIKRIKDLFWQEIYKFNYRGAEILLDSVEDYMKGPAFIAEADGEQILKQKKEKDNELYPVTPDIESMYKRKTLYRDIPLSGSKKMLYDYSYNGQFLPGKSGGKTAVIAYGWGYWPGRQYMADTIYAVDPATGTYTVYRKDKREFRRLTDRYKKIISDYNSRNKAVAKEYRDMSGIFIKEEFWNGYLVKKR